MKDFREIQQHGDVLVYEDGSRVAVQIMEGNVGYIDHESSYNELRAREGGPGVPSEIDRGRTASDKRMLLRAAVQAFAPTRARWEVITLADERKIVRY